MELFVKQESEIPSDWIITISDDEMKEVATNLAALAIKIPYIKTRVRELIWLICMEDKRSNVFNKGKQILNSMEVSNVL